ncbi:spermidine synthase [Thermomonospora catenispora]|uniref:spermine/spermidine synthase domain-containing protein n=1 Tax=Thermomonospora catenispora TaxID=2493090 RepID=UPI00111D3CBA|nr:spermidine synthase [Thermomonospora catenispora]TNY36316.1 spermidine synthase [Thermomonospora catenispora]
MDAAHETITVDRVHGTAGELVLRRTGPHHEIISNGVFLMDTRDGASERLLVTAALDHHTPPAAVLIGGLGVGFTLHAAARHPAAGTITVIEREPAVITWNRTHLRRHNHGALDDPRVRVHQADLHTWLRTTTDTYDVICIDTDNGPDWTVTDDNARLYRTPGLSLAAARLTPHGTLAVWSAAPSPAFHRRLQDRFAHVTTRTVPTRHGPPDVIYLARHPVAHTTPHNF